VPAPRFALARRLDRARGACAILNGMGLDNPLHILILLVVVLLVFGAKRLPEIGRSLGEGMRGFKDSISGDTHQSLAQAPPAAPVAAPTVAAATQAAPAPAAPSVPLQDPSQPAPFAG
jgi:sec-independent protein translocase protein TatA